MDHADPRPLLLTVTPNPSLDLLYTADTLVWDDANRVAEPRRRPGGQGVNLARAAQALGADAVAVALLGGAVGADLARAIRAEGIPLHAVPIEGDTRIFVAVHERSLGRSLLVNPRGPACQPEVGDALVAAVADAIATQRPAWVAACGSLPPGLDPGLYAAIGAAARAAGVRFVADCDGAALRRAAEAGCDLLAPNRFEAERLLESTITGIAGAAAAAATLLDRFRLSAAAVTLGAEGAVLATTEGVWHAAAPPAHGASAVGAGDAFLAALLLALSVSEAPDRALRRAVAAGTAVLSGTGSVLLPADAERELREQTRVLRMA